MNIEVRYFSRSGNTKKVADGIAKAAGVKAKDCSVPANQPVDLLFLGGAIYGFGLDENIKRYIAQLNADNVKAVALFSTSAIVKSGSSEMAKLLREKGIQVLSRDYYCRGEFAVMHKGRPNENDLTQAEAFALAAIEDADIA